MNKSDYKTTDPLYELFYGEKKVENGWYSIESLGRKVWNVEKVEEFWSAIRTLKIDRKDYDFSNMVFPTFEHGLFWIIDKKRMSKNLYRNKFNAKVSFVECVFEGLALFDYVKFERRAIFNRCKFNDKAGFSNAIFNEIVDFLDCQFQHYTTFVFAQFHGSCAFQGTKFLGRVSFDLVNFMGKSSFVRSKFNDSCRFNSTKFNESVNFRRTEFSGQLTLRNAVFYKEVIVNGAVFQNGIQFLNNSFQPASVVAFINCYIAEKQRSIIEINRSYIEEKGLLIFKNVVFNPNIKFFNSDMSNVMFDECELVPVVFSNCSFRKVSYRNFQLTEKLVVLVYELNRLPLLRAVDKLSSNKARYEHFEKIGETYRQIKKNQKDANNWAEAGDAYRSEMVMKQRVFWLKFITKWNPVYLFNWFLLAFNGLTSGFQQSMIRPVVWLVILFGAFALTYFLNGMVVTEALYQSLFNSFPISGRIGADENHIKALMLLQRILSTVLIAFFGLAVRARLKQ